MNILPCPLPSAHLFRVNTKHSLWLHRVLLEETTWLLVQHDNGAIDVHSWHRHLWSHSVPKFLWVILCQNCCESFYAKNCCESFCANIVVSHSVPKSTPCHSSQAICHRRCCDWEGGKGAAQVREKPVILLCSCSAPLYVCVCLCACVCVCVCAFFCCDSHCAQWMCPKRGDSWPAGMLCAVCSDSVQGHGWSRAQCSSVFQSMHVSATLSMFQCSSVFQSMHVPAAWSMYQCSSVFQSMHVSSTLSMEGVHCIRACAGTWSPTCSVRLFL
jgi:hypothetical protein